MKTVHKTDTFIVTNFLKFILRLKVYSTFMQLEIWACFLYVNFSSEIPEKVVNKQLEEEV